MILPASSVRPVCVRSSLQTDGTSAFTLLSRMPRPAPAQPGGAVRGASSTLDHPARLGSAALPARYGVEGRGGVLFGLENRIRACPVRGFESHSLRSKSRESRGYGNLQELAKGNRTHWKEPSGNGPDANRMQTRGVHGGGRKRPRIPLPVVVASPRSHQDGCSRPG